MSIKQYQHYCWSLWHPFQLPMQWALFHSEVAKENLKRKKKKKRLNEKAAKTNFQYIQAKFMYSIISHVGFFFCHLRTL